MPRTKLPNRDLVKAPKQKAGRKPWNFNKKLASLVENKVPESQNDTDELEISAEVLKIDEPKPDNSREKKLEAEINELKSSYDKMMKLTEEIKIASKKEAEEMQKQIQQLTKKEIEDVKKSVTKLKEEHKAEIIKEKIKTATELRRQII